jgi:penicillin-binding protein 1A
LVWGVPQHTTDDVPGYTLPLPQRGWWGRGQPQLPEAVPEAVPGGAPGGAPEAVPGKPASRGRRYLRRAAITLVILIGIFVIGLGSLLLATPSAGQATALAARQAAQHGIAYPGPVVPANFARPLIATEDKRFYSEPGVDPLAVGRVIEGKITGSQDQGGATIEQQLAKMLYTPNQTGTMAELKQVALALKLNYAYSKTEILRLYAEVAYYGHGYYGLEAASCGYFGHPASELTVVQGAMLAGVVNAPSIDDPISDPVNAHARLAHVIARMIAVGDLTPARGAAVLDTPLGLVPRDQAGC